jgi:ATP synthase protein I
VSFCTIGATKARGARKSGQAVKEDTKKLFKELFRSGSQASAIGLALVIAIFLGGALGYWLSQKFDNMLFFYLGLLFGIIAGFRNVYVMGKRTKL